MAAIDNKSMDWITFTLIIILYSWETNYCFSFWLNYFQPLCRGKSAMETKHFPNCEGRSKINASYFIMLAH